MDRHCYWQRYNSSVALAVITTSPHRPHLLPLISGSGLLSSLSRSRRINSLQDRARANCAACCAPGRWRPALPTDESEADSGWCGQMRRDGRNAACTTAACRIMRVVVPAVAANSALVSARKLLLQTGKRDAVFGLKLGVVSGLRRDRTTSQRWGVALQM